MSNTKKNPNKIVLPCIVSRNVIAFPNCPFSFDVGRTFSMKAIDDAKKFADEQFILVSQKDRNVDKPTIDQIYSIGSLCAIKKFVDNKNQYHLECVCLKKISITKLVFENNSFIAEGTTLDDSKNNSPEENALYIQLLNVIRTNKFNFDPALSRIIDFNSKVADYPTINMISQSYIMPTDKRQALLEANFVDRIKKLIEIINYENEVKKIDKKLQDELNESMNKNQKEYILREKIKQIHKELGEENEIDALVDRLEKEPFPENIKKKLKNEIKRYETMAPNSIESGMLKQYIDTLFEIPWHQKTVDNDDLINARKILDDDHFGLEKVKDRIIEYLAVKKTTGNLKAPILCFYGAPGVGKTSLGKSIARALGRKFFKVSLGGVSDEAEIRGHRRTYVASMPGRIINGLRRCGVINPVFLLDEVDKVTASGKGDPASALLEVLDPEQNFAFNDNYVEEPYDLSNVLFIATANYIENVPAPLRDRLELIELSSYTEIEKIKIAKNYLVKKELIANGLKENDLTFEDKAIQYIINHYTLEAGVRNLERAIAKIIRKIIVEKCINKKFNKKVIAVEDVKKYLGIEKIFDPFKDKENQIGVVTGLAYTEYGGSTLPIEVNYFPGKGSLILTGKLGDVMKESASIALDYVKANAKKYKIDYKKFLENDIHIHFPEGAIPKDGPSAGVAITIAIISCLTGTPVNADVAMTGEVNLRGRAIPIGGLREKSLAALRYGIKRIIVPLDNKRDASELPDEVKNNLEIIFMTKVDDAIKYALVK